MVIKMLGAFLTAFLVSAVFGRRFVSWLGKNKAVQPLKDEVAKIYQEQSDKRT